jgi:outer membrane receptor protein involved in Fe transport
MEDAMPYLLRLLPLLVAGILLAACTSPLAQETGGVSGIVVSAGDGVPLAWSNIMLVGTPYGGAARGDGTFLIHGVAPGTYSVKAQMISYKSQVIENVVVRAGGVVELRFELEPTVAIVLPTIETTGKRDDAIDPEKMTTSRKPDLAEIAVRPIDTLERALAVEPGIHIEDGQLIVRGGRPGETRSFADGLPIDDHFVQATSIDVSLISLAAIEVLTGGFDAEYGNALSGVINLKTREGGDNYSGAVKFMTDDFGAPDKTYFNYDHLSAGIGGPLFSKDLRFFASAEAVFSDTYLETLEPRAQKNLWGFIKYRDRQTNNYSAQGKVSYLLPGMKKLTAEILASGNKHDLYDHALSRVGYWSDANDHWWFEPLDSTYTLYVGPAHTPNVTNQHRSMKMVWRHTLGPSSFYTVRAGRFTTLHREVVLDKEPWQYVTPTADNRLDPANRYYVVQGDHPRWQRYFTTLWTGKGDMTIQKSKVHQMKFGLESNIYRLEMEDILFPSLDLPRGTFTDIYKFHCWSLSAFMQDRMRFEGMNVSIGMRFDLFDPGREAVEAHNDFVEMTGFARLPSSFMERTEWQISPRLGVSYPISERDALYFNYGRFYQIPRLEVLFQYLGDTGNGLLQFGNPLMDAATTIMYEVGIQRQLTHTVMGDIALFYKDIFGLTGTEAARITEDSEIVRRYGPGVTPIVYVNRDYGSVRGVEVKLSKRFTNRTGGSLTYTYSKATGSSSNELQGANVVAGGIDRTPITELPLNWDRNHMISTNVHISEPGLWRVNVDWSYSTGAPYTPAMPRERELRAALINSERLPPTSVVNLRADKQYRIAGQEIALFVEGRNLLDRKNVVSLSPGGGLAGGNGNYIAYYTSQGELGGAYDVGELLGLSDVIYESLNDPRVYGPPRNFRVGFSFAFPQE